MSLPELPFLQHLDLVTLGRPKVATRRSFPALRQLSLHCWPFQHDGQTSDYGLAALCQAAQLEDITLIGIPWRICQEWLQSGNSTWSNLKVLRLGCCEDSNLLSSMLSQATNLHEFCLLQGPLSFYETLPQLLQRRPLLQTVWLGRLKREAEVPMQTTCSLPADLALHPTMLALSDYMVCLDPFVNATHRNEMCRRLLQLRVSQPTATFEVRENIFARSRDLDRCELCLHVRIVQKPIIAVCTSADNMQKTREQAKQAENGMAFQGKKHI